MASYAAYRTRCFAVIDGIVVDVVAASITYELNAIPIASITLPLGREVISGETSPVHRMLSSLRRQSKIQLFVSVQQVAGNVEEADRIPLPSGEFVLFEGKVSGVAYQQAFEQAGLRIEAVHWLYDLTSSSMLSVNSHVTNPAHMTNGSVILGADAGSSHWTALAWVEDYLSVQNVSSDFWNDALRPLFIRLSELNHLVIAEQAIGTEGASAGAQNTGAMEALKRMRSAPDHPLQLLTGASDSAIIAEAIAMDVSAACSDPGFTAAHSFWDIILRKLVADYLFSIVPRPEDVLVVPFVGGMQKVFKTIKLSQNLAIAPTIRNDRPIRGVGVLSSVTSDTGAFGQQGGTSSAYTVGVGGYYAPPDATDDGLILIKRAPAWLSQLLSYTAYTPESVPGPGIIATAVQPDDATLVDIKDKVEKASEANKQVLDRYAETLYSLEVLKNRQAIVTMPLRFDIAPGSTIELEGTHNSFISGNTLKSILENQDDLATSWIAEVIRVTYQFTGGGESGGSIATSCHLAYVRDGRENKMVSLTTDRHPLYDPDVSGNPWNGAPLIGN